jgi:hypothetical protein
VDLEVRLGQNGGNHWVGTRDCPSMARLVTTSIITTSGVACVTL